jgi:type III secretory pathway component EscV
MSDDNIKPDHDLHLRNRFIAISALVAALMLFIPFPALVLDILWGLNLILILLTFPVTLHYKKASF